MSITIREQALSLYPDTVLKLVDVQSSGAEEVLEELRAAADPHERVVCAVDDEMPEHPVFALFRRHDASAPTQKAANAPYYALEGILLWHGPRVLELHDPTKVTEPTLQMAYLAAGVSEIAAPVFAAWRKAGVEPALRRRDQEVTRE